MQPAKNTFWNRTFGPQKFVFTVFFSVRAWSQNLRFCWFRFREVGLRQFFGVSERAQNRKKKFSENPCHNQVAVKGKSNSGCTSTKAVSGIFTAGVLWGEYHFPFYPFN